MVRHSKSRTWMSTFSCLTLVLCFAYVFRESSDMASARARLFAEVEQYPAPPMAEPFMFLHSQVSDPNCPRFVTHRLQTDAGIGHQLTELMASMATALIIPGATFVYQNNTNWDKLVYRHGSLAWAEDFFRFGFGEMSFASVTKKYNPRIVSVGGNFCNEATFTECNVMCERSSYFDQTGGKGISLLNPNVAMAYDRLKHVMRLKFRRSNFGPQAYLYSNEFYNVAWHVRVGDITLHADNSTIFENIMIQIKRLLEGFKVKMYVFAEEPSSGTNPPKGFGFMQDLIGGDCIFVNDMDPPNTLYHFANADMVINSGSSFSLIAELLSPKPIVIATPPKESVDCHFFETFDTLKTDNLGHIVGKSLSEARASIVDRYELFHLRRVPATMDAARNLVSKSKC